MELYPPEGKVTHPWHVACGKLQPWLRLDQDQALEDHDHSILDPRPAKCGFEKSSRPGLEDCNTETSDGVSSSKSETKTWPSETGQDRGQAYRDRGHPLEIKTLRIPFLDQDPGLIFTKLSLGVVAHSNTVSRRIEVLVVSTNCFERDRDIILRAPRFPGLRPTGSKR